MNSVKMAGILRYAPDDVWVKIDGNSIKTGNSKPAIYKRRTIFNRAGNTIILRTFENDSPTARELIIEALIQDGWTETAIYYEK